MRGKRSEAGGHGHTSQPGEPPVGALNDQDDAAVGADGAVSSPTAPDDQREIHELRDKYLHLAADFENFRRRVAKERLESASRAQSELARQLLDALDDLARFAHLDPATVDAKMVVEGVDLVERKLMKTLASAGLTVVNPLEQPFDPAHHEAVATEPAASPQEDQLVARVYQPGYLFNGQLLRAARVVVKQWTS